MAETTAKAIRIHETGGPDAMRWEDVPVGDPAAGEVRFRDVLAERGWMVSYGQSSGPARNAAELFGLIAGGVLKVEINQRYGLRDAAQAHADPEGRQTTGSTILIP